MQRPPFHLAFPVTDLEKTRVFFTELLKASVGRSSDRWIDFDFFGHQITAHLVDQAEEKSTANAVDGHAVPVRHFGVILEWQQWQQLADRLQQHNIEFLIKPYIRFKGEIGEQATLFISDPSGNGLEFKSFKNQQQVFANS